MAKAITIDRLGRIVVPQHVRRRLGLVAGSRLRLLDESDRIVLEPEQGGPELREEGGILVLVGTRGEAPDHRSIRDERLSRQWR
jgi:AbrB family looped-hinge helix DNA binding protein